VPRRPLEAEVTRARRRRDRLAAQLAAEDAALEALLRAQRELIEAVGEYQRLHEPKRTNIVPNVQAPIAAAKHSRRGRPLEAKHPFPRALEAAGMTVSAWALKHGHDRARVKSWFAEGDGGRRIPRDVAEAIEKEMGVDAKKRPLVPATLATWKNGIS
jgi:hypothetical protein